MVVAIRSDEGAQQAPLSRTYPFEGLMMSQTIELALQAYAVTWTQVEVSLLGQDCEGA